MNKISRTKEIIVQLAVVVAYLSVALLMNH